jgi:hypothetical protein
LLRDADGLPDVEVDWQLRDPELSVGAARIVGVDDAAQLQVDRRIARNIDAAVTRSLPTSPAPGRNTLKISLPVRAHRQCRRGDDVSGGRTAGHVFGIGAGGTRKVDRGKQYERAGADTERRVRIGLGQDRQQALRPLPEREGIGRLQVRRRRVGDTGVNVVSGGCGTMVRSTGGGAGFLRLARGTLSESKPVSAAPKPLGLP